MVEVRQTGRQFGEDDTTLVVAPEAKYGLERLADENPGTALVVACERTVTAVLEEWRRVVGAVEDVAVVVVGDDVRSVAESGDASGPLGNAIRNVSRYDDTESLVSVVSTALAELRSGVQSPTVYVESLTAFEQRVSLSRLVVTLGALSNAIGAADGRGHFMLDPDVAANTRSLLESVVGRTVEFGDDGERTVVERARRDPSVGTIFKLLASPERRFVLRRLDAAEGALSTGALADELAAASGLGGPERASVSLYHTLLPPLAEADVISFDRDGGHLDRGDAFDRVRRHLDCGRG